MLYLLSVNDPQHCYTSCFRAGTAVTKSLSKRIHAALNQMPLNH